MKNLIIMIGLPGSGKSTYVDKLLKIQQGSYQVVCRDDIRLSMGVEFEPKIESFIYAISSTMVRAYMVRGLNIIIDETNTHIGSLKKWMDIAREYSYEIELIIMNTTIDVCKSRRSSEYVTVIDRMNKQLEELLMDPLISQFLSVTYINGEGGIDVNIKRK